MDLGLKSPIGSIPFRYQKLSGEQPMNPKTAPCFYTKKQGRASVGFQKTQNIPSPQPQLNSHSNRASPVVTRPITSVTSPQCPIGIQFKEIRDRKQKMKEGICYSSSKRQGKTVPNNKTLNFTQSPKYFSHPQQSSSENVIKNICLSSPTQSDSKAKTGPIVREKPLLSFEDPKTPKRTATKGHQDETVTPTKSSQNPETTLKSERPENKACVEVQFVNKTSLVKKLALQLNQKQQKVAELEKKIVSNRNEISELMAQNTRQLGIEKRQKMEVAREKEELERSLKEALAENQELKTLLETQKQEMNSLQEKQATVEIRLQQLLEDNGKLKQYCDKLAQTKQIRLPQQIIDDIQQQLHQKSARIIQLQKETDAILIQMEKYKQSSINTLLSPIYSLPQEGNFNIFEEAFKTYISETDKYKEIIVQKDKEIEAVKEKYNVLRVENERLKNEVIIEEIRRATDLRNNDTIFSIQRESIMSQLKDTQRELSVSREKAQRLNNEIKSKDEFIMKNIKHDK